MGNEKRERGDEKGESRRWGLSRSNFNNLEKIGSHHNQIKIRKSQTVRSKEVGQCQPSNNIYKRHFL